MYVSLSDTRLDVRDFSRRIYESAQAEAIAPCDLTPDAAIDRIAHILGHDASLGASARALDVFFQRVNPFCRARILTDLRPVFTRDASSIIGAMEIHTLAITHHEIVSHYELGDREIFLSLDRDDLLELKRLCERALEKGKQVSQIAEAATVPWLET